MTSEQQLSAITNREVETLLDRAVQVRVAQLVLGNGLRGLSDEELEGARQNVAQRHVETENAILLDAIRVESDRRAARSSRLQG
ncbi:hypothetical protein [Parafrankia sp. FMc2]|uniref:hypothetical protein n=1 Tax=Parafrankia sp. FMc2 TaxID=3233196 RepID=UPI0034D579CF